MVVGALHGFVVLLLFDRAHFKFVDPTFVEDSEPNFSTLEQIQVVAVGYLFVVQVEDYFLEAEVDGDGQLAFDPHLVRVLDIVGVEQDTWLVGYTHYVVLEGLVLRVCIGGVKEADDQRFLWIYLQNFYEYSHLSLGKFFFENVQIVPAEIVVYFLEDTLVKESVTHNYEILPFKSIVFVDQFFIGEPCVLVHLYYFLDREFSLVLK